MRIIGGRYRGKKLISPSSEHVRPTSDKARESLFNILRNRLDNDFKNYNLIDIFSGSGAFALEALSQGFSKVVMIDKDIRDLQKNVALFPTEQNRIQIIKTDILNPLCLQDKYDVVFMDAPYNQGLTEKALINIKPFLKQRTFPTYLGRAFCNLIYFQFLYFSQQLQQQIQVLSQLF